ncbi:hypothetical protein BMS3Bbin11_00035 [bacterium BMS3Bbin11]|nr:hypothetical protein BMS3Bbin11_00035 [bacterium BMS3Bbin11]HDH07954.1 NAD(P)/FAD-dependent oxidoreductase [Gammaproteobacteria bacterium]HDH16875.1 NAD(P)/FAD-dependent oxidoreductase [Gammaproteobacteria bacterium]HDZ78918.1 NAD(P)/FAD-dependent oxidoreductase [Gammaproteobacteria bacterium]
MATQQDKPIQIAGAGPAGLSAAITLARAGTQVIVHEAQAKVGWRFKHDFQGLENWTTQRDVLQVLADDGITTDFDVLPGKKGMAYDGWGQGYPIQTKTPFFYLVVRGPGPGSLDHALLQQAQELGVDVRFKSRVKKLPFPSILATGPKAVDAIAVGYLFDTGMEDGFWVICDNTLAPGGYAYLLVWNGKGTVKTCMFSGFKQEKQHVEKTVAAFKRLVGLEMKNPIHHGGVGNFYVPLRAYAGKRPVVGEQAGFQDALWGFGIRHAVTSGILAARSLLEEADYAALWTAEFKEQLKVSIVNRALYNKLGNRGYRFFLKRISGKQDLRKSLYGQYHPGFVKTLLYPWASRSVKKLRSDTDCRHTDCECVWCRSCDDHSVS